MGKLGKPGRRLIIVLLCVLLPLGGAVLGFSLRAPVLLVTDLAFDALYGGSRGLQSRILHSLRLFRRVKPVRLPEAFGADVVLFTLEAAAARPYAVIFPYRYYAEAQRYAREFPGIPLAVLEGRVRAPEAEPPLTLIGTDSGTDFYRAGRCAALLAEAREAGGIYLIQDDLVTAEDREAFRRGLEHQGYLGGPHYLSSGSEYILPRDTACLVMAGTLGAFAELDPAIPVILFSWADPAIIPARIKLVFDDSPWGQLAPALEMVVRGKELRRIPSALRVLNGRIGDRGLRQNLKMIPAQEGSGEENREDQKNIE
jgi:hypothetical protein